MDTKNVKRNAIIGGAIGLVVGVIIVIVMGVFGGLDSKLEKATKKSEYFTYTLVKEGDNEFVKVQLKPEKISDFDHAFDYRDTGAMKPLLDDVEEVSLDTDKYIKFAVLNPYDANLILYIIKDGEVERDLTSLNGESDW